MKPTIALLLVSLLFGNVCRAEASESSDELEALKYKLMSRLLRFAAKPLPKNRHCDFHTTLAPPKATPTFGEWFAFNLQFFANGAKNSIGASCEKRNSSTLQCSLEFYADSDSESPWACGFRFDIDPKYQSIRPETIECIGSC